ncbi:hypothetical protein BBI17_007717, partial [Phytophthora kernoviae]
TSASKSSLMIAFFRICEFESGNVVIDGIDIQKMWLADLRRVWPLSLKIRYSTVAPYTVMTWGTGLNFVVSERDDNLSVGQRQLLCIGRALLKDSKIVMLDKPPANIDTATDQLIQVTIRETFVDKTVLIIAHRTNTILHCNKVAVMDAGRVVEFASPSSLLQQPNSIFASLVNRTNE